MYSVSLPLHPQWLEEAYSSINKLVEEEEFCGAVGVVDDEDVGVVDAAVVPGADLFKIFR